MGTCKYHQDQPATWQCKKCNHFYGDCCVPIPADSTRKIKCSLCTEPLTYLGGTYSAEPFWKKTHDFFVYPFQNNALIFLGIITLIQTGVFFLFGDVTSLGGLILYIAAMIVVGGIQINYFFTVINYIAEGEMEAPPATIAFSMEGVSLLFKQIALIVIAVICGIAAFKTSIVIGVIVSTLLYLFIPVSIMILAREHSLGEAMNPSRIIEIIKGMGWPYLLLFVFLYILTMGPNIATEIILKFVNEFFVIPIDAFFSAYFHCVSVAILGYCIYQYQVAFGFVSEQDETRVLNEVDYETKLALCESEIFMKEGRREQAGEVIRNAVNKYQKSLELNRRYHHYLKTFGQNELLTRHSLHFINLLLEQNMDREAAQVYMTCKEKQVALTFKVAETCHRLGAALVNSHRYKEAIVLLKNLHKLFPQYRGIPDAYFVMAKAFSEGLHQDEQAMKLLNFIIQKYPNAMVTKEVKDYQNVIQSIKKS
ncbi:DUF4013 domain-containing protein [Zooshikella harenae]|uniref:Tetratricopeptide repeat protein n=1 Tax=Zooshikella harenae TaxID=2827238 RepID=A0ABS5Z9L4_9GAMM|nr:DUF4013 domain-containing protein [Zooshikella harenae]MBU2710578.1 hypothetical protein [Zooshikella harenae]